ncbi:MAG TPA: PQQ-binding-like beta-propeller repeat protein, partial [Streptosporangiaceae bacterium]
RQLEPPAAGFPEEELFFAPDILDDPEPPWPLPLPRPAPWPLPLPRWPWPPPWPIPWPPPWLCWFLSRDWRMYHHDDRHSGHASGCSAITSTSVGGMTLRLSVPVDGPVITIPTIVQGKIYVGSSDAAGAGGTLYKIDLATGTVEHTFSVPQRFPAYSQGIGGSPAVVGGRVYFTAIPGWVYCLDAATFALLWSVDLRNPDPAHNQPVQNQSWTDSWSSPLVVGGKVYVGCGEGEGQAFGFVYCLDATTGNVVWLFCTNKFPAVTDNQPNVIPNSAVGISPLPAPFTAHADPTEVGVSIWSSCAYDATLNRIYVGTGNSLSGDFNPLPDAPYGSGMLALDAATGAFQGFFEPAAADCYRPDDTDVDVCGSPTVFARGGTRVVGIGSKGGGYFLLDAAAMTPLATRQLLPYQFNNPANPLTDVDPHAGPGENMYGVFGTAAIHYGLGRLFVGIGGYGGAIDTPTTPFVRALDWTTLNDAWPTTVGADGVTRYTAPGPLYANPGEVGLSSPAVVNDVVFVSTDRPGLYALSAATGLCLWSAGGLSPGYILGPAVYGNMVVVGSGSSVKVYSL